MILRRNFLSLVLLAPLAKLFGREAPIDLSKVKLTKIMGTMNITGDAMKAMGLDPEKSYPEDTVWSKASKGRDSYEATLRTYEIRFSASGR